MLKHDASGKKGKLLCCKRIFDWIKANLADIQPQILLKCPKNAFFAKSSRSQWVNKANLIFCLTFHIYLTSGEFHCPGDMAVCRSKVLARPWVGVRVCHFLLLLISKTHETHRLNQGTLCVYQCGKTKTQW